MKKIYFFSVLFLLTATNKVYCQQSLTIGEIYDYNINDEFHSRVPNIPPNANRIIVTGKYFSNNNDTVFYSIHYDNYSSQVDYSTNPPHLVYQSFVGNNTISYTNLDSLISLQYYFEPSDSCDSFHDTTYYSSQFCGQAVYEYTTCFGCCFEGEFTSETFGKGLGFVLHYYQNAEILVAEQWEKFYFKKDSIECGTPDTSIILSTSELEYKISSILIYPNPATNQLTIDQQGASGKELTVKIFNPQGQLVYQCAMSNEQLKIDINSYSKGVYFINLTDGEQVVNRKFIKE